MCIGRPMQVQAAAGAEQAWCEGEGERACVDMRLVGPQPAGTWLLVFQGAARQVLGEAEAAQASAARRALAAALRGESGFDEYFADLAGRTPELPEHLRRRST